MKPICIIPARGGSKGLPRKNVLPLAGRPLLAWSVLAALEACGEGNVFVTTDDPEIAEVAVRFGAEVIDRPPELAGDAASSEAALVHALGEVEKRRAGLPECFVFMQCTSPLTVAEDVRSILAKLDESGADSALSGTSSHRFLWKPGSEESVEGVNHDSRVRLRRQDRDPEFAENGALYAMKTTGFLKGKHRFFGRTILHEMPEERSWEIDSLVDFQIAEVLLRERLRRETLDLLPIQVAAVVFDFDGVMTDNRVLTSQDGGEAVTCDRSDGLGVAGLRAAGIPVLVLSTEVNSVVAARCRKLGVDCIHGQEDKRTRLLRWIDEHGHDASNIVYVGNDRNDSGCLEVVGCPVAVADAYPEALRRALIVLKHQGGKGSVREICDLIAEKMKFGGE